MSVLLSIVTVAAFDHKRLKLTIESTRILPRCVEHVIIVPEHDRVSCQILQDAKEKGRSLKVAHDSNSGVYSAMNLGTVIASGKYVIFWNCGDLLYSISDFESFLNQIAVSKPTWAVARGVLENGNIHKNSQQDILNFRDQKLGSYLSHQVIACNRKIMFDLGLFDKRYKVAADTKMIQEFMRITPPLISDANIVFIETPQYSSRFHRRSRYETAKLAFRALIFSFAIKQTINVFMRELNFTKKLIYSLIK